MTPPLVSILTPFHNTADYLPACIESVLAQTYSQWEYVLVDNSSTDESGDIARAYAARDPRLRVLRTPSHLSQMANYNFALRAMSERAVYSKIVQADDWISPPCVELMVGVAERHPRVGIVSSYHLMGREVLGDGLLGGQEVFPGRDVSRAQLLEGRFFLGSNTSVLYRASIVRARDPFYDVEALHADTEVGYQILQSWDFGFVHQVLTFLRVEDDSISGRVRDFNPNLLDKLIVLRKYGPAVLSPTEFATTWAEVSGRYWRYLGKRALRRRPAAFWDYHSRGLATIGERLSTTRLVRYGAAAVIDMLLHPKETLADLRRLTAP